MSITARVVGNAESYAETIGLLDLLAGNTLRRRPKEGASYSPLVELTSHAEVDPSNRVINELIHGQLYEFPHLAAQASIITGELHDNVPSHAMGAGFSMAQYYGQDRMLEVCVADAGRGMLANVRTVAPTASTDGEAIQWCLGEGHTTAKPVND